MCRVVVELSFEAAHRLLGYKGICNNLHGHSYKLLVSVSGDINEMGFVVDFDVLEKKLKRWISKNWDHSVILNKRDTKLISFLKRMNFRYFLLDSNPTAENMAVFLKRVLEKKIGKSVQIVLYETQNSSVRVGDE